MPEVTWKFTNLLGHKSADADDLVHAKFAFPFSLLNQKKKRASWRFEVSPCAVYSCRRSSETFLHSSRRSVHSGHEIEMHALPAQSLIGSQCVDFVRPLLCEGGVDVVGVVTPLVRGVAQVLHGDQVVELSGRLEVQEVERRRQGRTGRSRRGESRTQGETHMYMDDK